MSDQENGEQSFSDEKLDDEKLEELREKRGKKYVDAALKAAGDSLKIEEIEDRETETKYFRCSGSIGVDGKVMEINGMSMIDGKKKKDIEDELRARTALTIVFLEEGIVKPEVPE